MNEVAISPYARVQLKKGFPEPYDDMIDIMLDNFIPGWREAANDYGRAFMELGLRGQYVEVQRKVYKLKQELWEGRKLNREDSGQIALELIGNCLIIAWLYSQIHETARAKATDTPTLMIAPLQHGSRHPKMQQFGPADE